MIGSENAVSGDERIARAFRRSLVVLAVLALLVVAAVYVARLMQDQPAPVTEQVIQGPEIPTQPTQVHPPTVQFTDVTEAAGIDFVHVNGAYGDKLLPETMGSGVAVFDYDGDGDQDLLFVNARHWPGRTPRDASVPTPALYRNDGSGRFEDVSAGSGLDTPLYGMGVAVADYDADGDRDVFVTAVGENRLFRNDGGRFVDVTGAAGVAGAPEEWSTAAAFLDYDGDGDLDLFVANYVRWSKAIDFEIDFQLTGIGRAYGPPSTFEGRHPYLYRNEGDGRFTDVSAAAGVQVTNPATGRPMAKALGVSVVDLDGDGALDLFVANDTVQNFLFHNQGDGTFAEIGTLAGVAFDRNGSATGAMGTDAAHFRNDADLGIAVGNFANEMTSLYVAQGDPLQYADEAIGAGIGPATRLALTFGLFFFDFDLDGRLDLFQTNGHLEEDINLVQASQHYAQPAQLFWNCGSACPAEFVAIADAGAIATPMVGRGAAYGDLDGDGDLDLVVTQVGRPPLVLRNDQTSGHRWLRVSLVGRAPNTDAIGARVEVAAAGVTQRRQVVPTRSYLSQVELPVTFGLGEADRVEVVRVRWPNGAVQEIHDVQSNRVLVVEQGG